MAKLFAKTMVTRDGINSGNCFLVVGRDALYILPGFRRGGGLLSIAEATLKGVSKTITTLAQGKYVVRASDLPDEVRSNPNWPQTRDDQLLFALPRVDGKLSHPKFSNELHVHVGTEKLKLTYPWFSHGKLFAHCRKCNWEI